MRVREAAAEDAGEVLAFVGAKAQFDRELGAFSGELGTTEELIRRHLFGLWAVGFARSRHRPHSASCFETSHSTPRPPARVVTRRFDLPSATRLYSVDPTRNDTVLPGSLHDWHSTW